MSAHLSLLPCPQHGVEVRVAVFGALSVSPVAKGGLFHEQLASLTCFAGYLKGSIIQVSAQSFLTQRPFSVSKDKLTKR